MLFTVISLSEDKEQINTIERHVSFERSARRLLRRAVGTNTKEAAAEEINAERSSGQGDNGSDRNLRRGVVRDALEK